MQLGSNVIAYCMNPNNYTIHRVGSVAMQHMHCFRGIEGRNLKKNGQTFFCEMQTCMNSNFTTISKCPKAVLAKHYTKL